MSTITLAIRRPIDRRDLPRLYDRVCGILEATGATVALCDVAVVDADAVSIDALARLRLAARRHACGLRLLGASPELLDLVRFCGMESVLVAAG